MSEFEYVLGLGDDALIAAQRLAEWCSRAPEMEEDVALANIALDQLGVARLLLTYAGELEGAGLASAPAGGRPLSEDALAYLRDDREFRNCLLVELPEPDFAVTMAKLLFLSAYQKPLYERLVAAGEEPDGDERLSAIAAKARKESEYHLDHASLWTVRLGDGTDESHRRIQDAVDALWPYTHELFDGDHGSLRPRWLATVEGVLDEATLTRPADGGWTPGGGRQGLHTEHLSYLLAEMQVVHRAHPGARW
ncbi:MAG: phenylacetate-CoA oxygenase PaaI subunit [Dactylosporangium sp.]|jgi:ring-1,2-phenylacetyl-CoA epoxidase subunit PaaC|nr:phenylacetate-CoA oxygenase PaaI subunit [Dactylosporangium sp.]